MKNNFVSKFLYKFNKPCVEDSKRDKLLDKAVEEDYIQGYLDYLARVEQYEKQENIKDE